MILFTRAVIYIVAMCTAVISRAQYNLPVKEQFDKLSHKVIYNGTYDGIVNYMLYTNPWNGYQYGENIGPTLEGYIRMYETTKDKAYLIKFINLALRAVAWRKLGYRFNDLTYMDGQLLWPLAHFIHLILIDDPALGAFQIVNNSILLSVPASTIPANELPTQSTYSLSEIASWFLARSVESMDTIIDEQWNQNIGFEGAAAVNMQGGFAGALLHLGHMATVNSTYSGLQSYLDRGAKLSALFRSNINIDDDCSCSSYSEPVLRTSSQNSYWWYHSGWSWTTIPSCVNQCTPFFHFNQPNLLAYQQFIEDISHAIPALIIPIISHRYSIYTAGSFPFTDTEMVRFRNTFTKHIWDDELGGFHNAVNGQDAPIFPSTYDGQFNVLNYNALAWMPLQHFDETSGAATGDGIYSIVMDFYADEVHDNPTVLTGGFHYLGLADVVAAQWENECFNLDLYNRELVYDQDFSAKNVLRVHPEGEVGRSFAEPEIYEPRFTVKGEIRAQFRAGNAVIFEPGFEAEYESVVEALIDPLGCGLSYKAAIPVYGLTEVASQRVDYEAIEEISTSTLDESSINGLDVLRLAPNPSTGQSFATLQLEATRDTFVGLYDGTGRMVWSASLGRLAAGEHRVPLAHALSSGIYQCLVFLDGVPLMERLVQE